MAPETQPLTHVASRAAPSSLGLRLWEGGGAGTGVGGWGGVRARARVRGRARGLPSCSKGFQAM